MPDTALKRRDGVELVRTGSWPTMTGTWQPKPADLAAAVDAQSCPAIRNPVIRLGHTDPRFRGDGEPALGWFENLRLADGGHTLLADQVTLSWLHDVQAAAYPDRSVEGNYNHRCQLGHTHPFVVRAVALLGVTPPGVGTLRSIQDLPDALGVAASTDIPEGATPVQVTVRAAAEPHTGAMVALVPTGEDAQRLAVEGGEPVDQLHVTLAYLGEAADLTPAARQDIIAVISEAFRGAGVIDARAFGVSLFNPDGGEDGDKQPCAVLTLSGGGLDEAHIIADIALSEVGVPEQYSPWHAHLALHYGGGFDMLPAAADKVGPVTFDRVRIAFAGEAVDVPLIPDDTEPGDPDTPEGMADEDWAAMASDDWVSAAANDDNNLREYFTRGAGLKRWADKPHPWTALYRILRRHVGDERARRIAASWFHRVFGLWPGDKRHRSKVAASWEGSMLTAAQVRETWNQTAPYAQWIVEIAPDLSHVVVVDDTDRSFARVPVLAADGQVSFGDPVAVRPGYLDATEPVAASTVFASRAESRPDVAAAAEPKPADGPADPEPATASADPPEPPAAEPDPPTEPKGEDPVSTLNADVRARLGLADDAADDAILAALDALKTKADTPAPTPEPDPQLVAAAAAQQQENEELRKEVQILASKMQSVTEELAAEKAAKAATVKASVLDAAVADGKIKPADREQWEADYDQAPAAITRVLASIAKGTAVPTATTGGVGQPLESGDSEEAMFDKWDQMFSTPAVKES